MHSLSKGMPKQVFEKQDFFTSAKALGCLSRLNLLVELLIMLMFKDIRLVINHPH